MVRETGMHVTVQIHFVAEGLTVGHSGHKPDLSTTLTSGSENGDYVTPCGPVEARQLRLHSRQFLIQLIGPLRWTQRVLPERRSTKLTTQR
jgi:hypothetical protein